MYLHAHILFRLSCLWPFCWVVKYSRDFIYCKSDLCFGCWEMAKMKEDRKKSQLTFSFPSQLGTSSWASNVQESSKVIPFWTGKIHMIFTITFLFCKIYDFQKVNWIFLFIFKEWHMSCFWRIKFKFSLYRVEDQHKLALDHVLYILIISDLLFLFSPSSFLM